MRLIDADALYRSFEEVYREPDYSLKDAAWWFFGKLGDAQTITPPPNAPLTLEELREMDGEPVWIETTDVKNANRLAFVDVGCEVVRFFDTRCGVKCQVMGNHFRTYGKTWIAYRRKPEEVTS